MSRSTAFLATVGYSECIQFRFLSRLIASTYGTTVLTYTMQMIKRSETYLFQLANKQNFQLCVFSNVNEGIFHIPLPASKKVFFEQENSREYIIFLSQTCLQTEL